MPPTNTQGDIKLYTKDHSEAILLLKHDFKINKTNWSVGIYPFSN